MQKFLEATGENRDTAVENALKQLGLERDDVSVEVLEIGKKGFLGIGATPARVRVTYEAPDIPAAKPEVKREEVHFPLPYTPLAIVPNLRSHKCSHFALKITEYQNGMYYQS